MTAKKLKEILEKVSDDAIVSIDCHGHKTVTEAYEIIKTDYTQKEPTTTHRLVFGI